MRPAAKQAKPPKDGNNNGQLNGSAAIEKAFQNGRNLWRQQSLPKVKATKQAMTRAFNCHVESLKGVKCISIKRINICMCDALEQC